MKALPKSNTNGAYCIKQRYDVDNAEDEADGENESWYLTGFEEPGGG